MKSPSCEKVRMVRLVAVGLLVSGGMNTLRFICLLPEERTRLVRVSRRLVSPESRLWGRIHTDKTVSELLRQRVVAVPVERIGCVWPLASLDKGAEFILRDEPLSTNEICFESILANVRANGARRQRQEVCGLICGERFLHMSTPSCGY